MRTVKEKLADMVIDHVSLRAIPTVYKRRFRKGKRFDLYIVYKHNRAMLHVYKGVEYGDYFPKSYYMKERGRDDSQRSFYWTKPNGSYKQICLSNCEYGKIWFLVETDE